MRQISSYIKMELAMPVQQQVIATLQQILLESLEVACAERSSITRVTVISSIAMTALGMGLSNDIRMFAFWHLNSQSQCVVQLLLIQSKIGL